MSNDKTQDKRENEGLSRRKFFKETAVKGGAVLVGTAASVQETLAQDGKKTDTNNQKAQASTAAKLVGEMVEYKSNDLTIPAYFSRANRKQAPAVLVIHEVFGLNDHIKSVADRI